jgi:hypothetical protein
MDDTKFEWETYYGNLCRTCSRPFIIRIRYDFIPQRDRNGVIITFPDGNIKQKRQFSYHSSLCPCRIVIMYRNGAVVVRNPATYDEKVNLLKEYESNLKSANPLSKINISKEARKYFGLIK